MKLWLDKGRWQNRQDFEPVDGGGTTTTTKSQIPPYPTTPPTEGMFYDLKQTWKWNEAAKDWEPTWEWVLIPIQGYQQWLAEQQGARQNQLLSLVGIFAKLSDPAKSAFKDVLKGMGVDIDQLMGGAGLGFEPTVRGAPSWMPAGMALPAARGATRGRGEDVLSEDVAALLAWALAGGREGRAAPSGVPSGAAGWPPPPRQGQPGQPPFFPPVTVTPGFGGALPSGAFLPGGRLPAASIGFPSGFNPAALGTVGSMPSLGLPPVGGFPSGFDPRALYTGLTAPPQPTPQAEMWAPYAGLTPEQLIKALGL